MDDVLLSQEKEIHPTTSLDDNCIEFEFQTDRNYYVDLRQTYMALKLKFVKSGVYETYNTKELKTSTKKRLKRMWKRRRSSKGLQFLSLCSSSDKKKLLEFTMLMFFHL